MPAVKYIISSINQLLKLIFDKKTITNKEYMNMLTIKINMLNIFLNLFIVFI